MSQHLEAELEETRRELRTAEAEVARLQGLLGMGDRRSDAHREVLRPRLFAEAEPLPRVDTHSSPEAKLRLYRILLSGRDDVYAQRWENAKTGKSGWSPAVRGGWGAARRRNPEYLPFSDEVIDAHLAGRITAGLYPLLSDDACRLLAADFDGRTWVLDALAYLDACRAVGVPAALERSRSGNGGHVWMFFSQPVAAATARRLGARLLREAMAARAELDLASYDRLFPAQDFVPKGSFGNLIALPVQGECRRRGNTVFLDPSTLEPWKDQWEFLSSVARLDTEAVEAAAEALRPVDVGPAARRLRQPTRHADRPAPPSIRAVLGTAVSIERIGLPPALLASLKHVASLHNPAFYERERLRLSTWRVPRLVRCYQEDLEHLHLPRGLRTQIRAIVAEAGSQLVVTDRRPEPAKVSLRFQGVLSSQQQQAMDALAAHELGVLVAPPGEGKTVMACSLIAHHGVPTLVLADRKPLIEQWRARLESLLDLSSNQIGQLGAGRTRRSGIVDLASIQTLVRRSQEDNEALFSEYGLVVVDECHHIPAETVDRCLRTAPTRRWLGLTATPYRRQGLEEIIQMHFGPVRHNISIKQSASSALLRRELIVHETLADPSTAPDAHIQDVLRALAEDEERTGSICDDVAHAIQRGRNCLVLTQRISHLEQICEGLRGRELDPLVLRGGMGRRAQSQVGDQLAARSGVSQLLLVATGSYIGEGFDCPRLDTVFFTFPFAWKGSVVQYAGRVLRSVEGKQDVEVHDYVDVLVPVVRQMHNKRLSGYSLLGFSVPRNLRTRRS
jgi:superfamily II DNA or RNA helicase